MKIHPPQLRLPPRYLRPGIEIQRMCRVSQYTVLSGSAGNCQGIQTDLWAPTHLHPSFALKKLGQADGVEMSQRWCPICPSHRHRLHPPVPAPPLCEIRQQRQAENSSETHDAFYSNTDLSDQSHLSSPLSAAGGRVKVGTTKTPAARGQHTVPVLSEQSAQREESSRSKFTTSQMLLREFPREKDSS